MTRSIRFVVAAVVLAFALGAWRVFESGGAAALPERVPIVAEGDLLQVGGALGDFDVAGDRLVAAIGQRVVVGQLGAPGAWSTAASSPIADDGIVDIDIVDGRWAAVLRGRHLCLVDVRADGPIAFDRCVELAVPAVHLVSDGGWCAVELRDRAVSVYRAAGGTLTTAATVVRPAIGYSGFAIAGDAVAVIELGDAVCGYALPDGAALGCGQRPGVNGLYTVGDAVAGYTPSALVFDRPNALTASPIATLPLTAPPTGLAGGHGVLALQRGGTLTVVALVGDRPEATDHPFEGRLGGVAAAAGRTCWSRMLGKEDRTFSGIRCVATDSGDAVLSLAAPGIVEHALQIDGRIALVDATVGVGLVDLSKGTIELLADGTLLRHTHGLGVSADAVAVAMGEDGFALLDRPLRSLSARSVAWRNPGARQAIGIGIDGERVVAADSTGTIVVADRRTGATTQRFETGGYPLEVLPTSAGVFVGNREQGLALMRRTSAGDYDCCTTVLTGTVTDMAISGDRLAITRGDKGISLAPLADVAAGRIAAPPTKTGGPALGVAFVGDRLVVAEADGNIEVFDAPAGGAVTSRGRRQVGGIPERVWADGGGLVVASELGGVSVVADVAALALTKGGPPSAIDAGVALYAPDELAAAIARDEVVVLDVRRPEEFAESHIPGARSVPLTDVARFIAQSDLGAKTVVPYCMKDFRGYDALRLLQQGGVTRVGAIDGFGLAAWQAAKLPVAGTSAGQDDAAALAAIRAEVDGR
ncbi:MAG: rhodanese-like domain-containing protein [Ardenticatenales bacterium]